MRDDAAPADAADELNAELSRIASDLQGEVTIIAQGQVTGRDAVALADERVLTPDELDVLRRQTAELNAQYKKALAAADKANAERVASIARVQARLEAAGTALARIDATDTARYAQGLADFRRVLEELAAVSAPAGGGGGTGGGATPATPVAPAVDLATLLPLTCKTIDGRAYLVRKDGKYVGADRAEAIDGILTRAPGELADCQTTVAATTNGVVCAIDDDNLWRAFRIADNRQLGLLGFGTFENCLRGVRKSTGDVVCGNSLDSLRWVAWSISQDKEMTGNSSNDEGVDKCYARAGTIKPPRPPASFADVLPIRCIKSANAYLPRNRDNRYLGGAFPSSTGVTGFATSSECDQAVNNSRNGVICGKSARGGTTHYRVVDNVQIGPTAVANDLDSCTNSSKASTGDVVCLIAGSQLWDAWSISQNRKLPVSTRRLDDCYAQATR